jgi:hypothetical protein
LRLTVNEENALTLPHDECGLRGSYRDFTLVSFDLRLNTIACVDLTKQVDAFGLGISASTLLTPRKTIGIGNLSNHARRRQRIVKNLAAI